jgi:hypothetical protein
MKPASSRIKFYERGFSRLKDVLLFFSGLIPVYPLNMYSFHTLFSAIPPFIRIPVVRFAEFTLIIVITALSFN